MAIETRPVDSITAEHLLIGMPYIEFAPAVSGGFDPYRQLGIIDSSELTRELDLVVLNSAQSGTQVKIRELISRIDLALAIGVFNMDPDNMRLILGASAVTAVGGGATVVTNDAFQLPSSDTHTSFADLSNGNITTEPLTSLDAATVTDEAVGIGTGALGAVSGEYALDYPVDAVTDITGAGEITVAGVAFTAIATGAAAAGNEVEVVVGASSTSGNLQFFVGGVATDVADGSAILATYTPGHTYSNATDYMLDPANGRIRILDTDKARAGQTLHADYTYTATAHNTIAPITQTVFAGRGRLKLLTDVGINIIWPIPSVSIRLTDDPFTFSRDEFGVGNLIMNLLDDGTSAPYGTMELYDETP